MAEGEPRLAIDLYAGGRLTYLQADLGVNRAPPPDPPGLCPHYQCGGLQMATVG